MRAAAVALSLALVACGDAEPAEGLAELEPSCGLALVPSAPLVAEVEAAAERWGAATGCAVRIARGGYRVRLVEPMFTRRGEPQPGLTHWLDTGELVIDVTEARGERVAPHEIGHLLRVSRGVELLPKDAHLADGFSLMVSGGGEGFITEADLQYVCAGFPCAHQAPEI